MVMFNGNEMNNIINFGVQVALWAPNFNGGFIRQVREGLKKS